MALQIGDEGATNGMTKEIYEKLNELLMPKVPAENLIDAQKGWKQLAFAISAGVVAHIVSNMEITGLGVAGPVSLTVAGGTATGNVTLAQSSTTTGLVR
jgi:hypothetical protein